MQTAKTAAGLPRLWYVLAAVVLLLVLLLSSGANRLSAQDGPAASGRSPEQPGSSYVKIIAPAGLLDAEAEGISLWHDYGAFALYRASEAALNALPADVRAQVILNDDDKLWFEARPIDTRAEQAAQPMALSAMSTQSASEDSAETLHLVQFVGPIKDEWLVEVERTGAKLVQYIATNGYLVWADGASRTELDRMASAGDFLQYSGEFPVDLKIGPALTNRLDSAADLNATVNVVVQMVSHKRQESSEVALQNLTQNQLSGWAPVLNFRNADFTVRLADIDAIANLPDVYWIEERMERERLDEVQGQIIAGNFNADRSGPASPGYLAWLASYGFSTNPADYPIVDITDDGIGNGTVNSGDPTLHELGVITNPSRLSYVANCTSAADGSGPDGHGHINVSIAGGYDTTPGFPYVDGLGYQRGLGINPFGRFAGTRVFGPSFSLTRCGNTDTGLIQSIQNSGAQISSNSWGCSGCAGSYDDSSQAFDAGVRDADPDEPGNQEMIFIFASGNSGPGAGTVGTPGNGKNMITVGASENQRPTDEDGNWTDGCLIGPTGANNAMDVIDFSSRGPSPGGRVKPEVIAPGTHIQGTASTHPSYNGTGVCDQFRPSGQTVFAASSGTSHSTPAVAGVSSLAYYWMENVYGLTGPSNAVMKAYLIAHPTYLTGVSANDTLPSNSQGYGMPNMSEMFDDAAKYLLDQTVVFDNSGETWVWEGAAADPSLPVRIVMAYTDAPGAIGTSPQVNNLDLSANVDGTVYLGNEFSGQWSVPGGTPDALNNYEAIFLPAGMSGSIEITVSAFNIAGDGIPNNGDGTDQDFAIVCYNCAQTPTYSIDVTPLSLDVCAPADAVFNVNVSSILGYTDPVTLGVIGNPAGTTATFSQNPVTPPGSSALTIGNTGSAAFGTYTMEVTATSAVGDRSRTVDLNLYTAAPAAPSLVTPADGAVDVGFKPAFSWTAVDQASSYHLEVALDPAFNNIVYTADVEGTSHTAATALNALTTYYWRVTAQNVCGSSTSATFSFTTQEATMICNGQTVDFEDGIPADWEVVDNTGGTGLVWTTTADTENCGIANLTNGTGEAACADSDATGFPPVPYDTELVSNPFDLSAFSAATLNVKGYYRDLTAGANDRFQVDVWNGTAWTNELTWDENHQPEDFTVNLAAYAGLPTVQVRFRYSGDGFDWYAQVDDVSLTCVEPGEPEIEVSPDSFFASQGPDIVTTQLLEIANTGASNLTWSITETATSCDTPSDVSWLSVDPDAGTTVPLGSDDVDVIFDTAGMVPGDHTAVLCVSSNDATTPLIEIPVALTVEPPEQLLCNGSAIGFEQGIPPGWQVVDNTGGTGLVWTTTADTENCGFANLTNGTGEAACADSDATGIPATPFDTELWTPVIDLSTWGVVQLDVKAYYRDLNTGANDRFEVDVWDGTSWNNELSWDEDHEPEDFTLNLSAYAGLSDTRVRFRYFGDGFDWFAQVDDIALTCLEAGAPDIAVSPESLEAELGPDTVATQQLTIANEGTGALNWTIAETETTCDSPGDVSWLSASPDAGATVPLDSDSVGVSFDSTGLSPGGYSASLCIQSDDPDEALVTVPVSLTVLPPFELTCNGPVADFNDGIPPGWQVVDNEGNGVVWTTIAGADEDGNYTGGTGDAATASSDRFGAAEFDTELRTFAFDLSDWLPTDDVALVYLANYSNFVNFDFLDVDVSTDGGASWTNLLSWNEDHGGFRSLPGEAVSIDLSPYAGLSNVQVRWRYYDPDTGDWDWYAQIDDAGLACVHNPVVEVEPDSLVQNQIADTVESQDLTIGNAGSADLVWTVSEGTCAAPEDYSWLSAAPGDGTTAPGDSSTVSVSFDTSGFLPPSTYSGTLCVASNDPATPEVEVPVTLNVIYDFSGFFGAVRNPPAINSVRAGSAVPFIFSLNGNWGLDFFADGYPALQQVDCATLEPLGPLMPINTGALSYKASTDRYTLPWKTDKSWAGTCGQVLLELDDGMTYVAYFQFR